jgi:two-component system KDP operon response regulator KdpE
MTADASILLIEDDPHIRRFLRASLATQGFTLVEAGTAKQGLALAAAQPLQLILLDLGLPDGDGVDVTRRLREWTEIPIIVISARGQDADKVAALDAGADDYLTKPFSLPELLARVRVALRRAGRAGPAADEPVTVVGDLRLDVAQRRVFVGGTEVHLTPTEFRILALLARSAGRVLTHRQILREIWGHAHEQDTHYLRVQMHGLRHKIEAEPARPRFLLTEPGVGYRLRSDA